MRRSLVLVLCGLVLLGCGDTGVSDKQDGGGGAGGTAGAGGAGGIAASVDAACRSFCANEDGGTSCGPGTEIGEFQVSAGVTIKSCYDLCLSRYEYEANRVSQCEDEFISAVECYLDLNCEDLFGDCDGAAEAYAVGCVQTWREATRDSCEQACPDDVTLCIENLAQGLEACANIGGTGGAGGMAGTAGSGGVGGSAGTAGSGGQGGAGGGALKDCDSLEPKPSGCGQLCDVAADCPLGTYCDRLGICAAQCVVRDDCTPGYTCNERGVCSKQCQGSEDCGPGYTCNARGLCSSDLGGAGGSSGTGGVGGGNACQSIQVTPSRSISNVMFLLDQSGSMVEAFGGGENRWEAAHSAINSIVSDLDSIVRFGLTSYTSRNGNQNPPCPRLPVAGDPLAASARIDFGLNNAPAFSNTNIYPYRYPNDAGEDTPTGDSIDALVSLIQADPPPNQGPTIIVLATDGEPDSCEYPDPSNGSPEQTFSRDEVVTAAAAANAAGIDVFVLWVGQLSSNSTRNHLQEVADVGVGGTGTVWVGDNPANLSNAFQSIISDSISCDVTMQERFDDKNKACAQGDVRLNGTPLSCPAEWRVKPGVDDVIELVGSACQTFKSGSSTFTAEFPCGAIVVQ